MAPEDSPWPAHRAVRVGGHQLRAGDGSVRRGLRLVGAPAGAAHPPGAGTAPRAVPTGAERNCRDRVRGCRRAGATRRENRDPAPVANGRSRCDQRRRDSSCGRFLAVVLGGGSRAVAFQRHAGCALVDRDRRHRRPRGDGGTRCSLGRARLDRGRRIRPGLLGVFLRLSMGTCSTHRRPRGERKRASRRSARRPDCAVDRGRIGKRRGSARAPAYAWIHRSGIVVGSRPN